MPLLRYGVAVGTFHDFRRDPSHDFGHWYHGHLSLDTTAGLFQSALDVDAPSSVGVSYRLVDDLAVSDIPTLQVLTTGFHLLASTPASGALDYARSPLLRDSSWFGKAREAGQRIEQAVRRPSAGAPVFHPTAGDVVAKWLMALRRRMAHRLPSTAACRPHPRIFPWVSTTETTPWTSSCPTWPAPPASTSSGRRSRRRTSFTTCTAIRETPRARSGIRRTASGRTAR
ncbi:DUF2278 family protein [Streptomyces roseoverticillatus]|nr:DUF2278 family protein [Streptomyces roseoverticillatus]